jgi:hypothetical protein
MQVKNSAHKKLGKAVTMHGKRCPLAICRQLFRLQPGAAWPPSFSNLTPAPGAAEKGAQKKGKKGKKGAAKAVPAGSKLASQDEFSAVVEGGKLLMHEEVVASKTGTFDMEALGECVLEAGRYGTLLAVLEATLGAVLPLLGCLSVHVVFCMA